MHNHIDSGHLPPKWALEWHKSVRLGGGNPFETLTSGETIVARSFSDLLPRKKPILVREEYVTLWNHIMAASESLVVTGHTGIGLSNYCNSTRCLTSQFVK